MIQFCSKLVKNNGPLFVCCSGGKDSIAVGHFLSRQNKEVALFHFNHKLRPQNDEMENCVRSLEWGLRPPLIVSADQYPLDIKQYGLEGAAHNARIQAMLHAAEVYGINNFILCHHLDDCIESYLMGCFNGEDKILPVKSIIGPITLYRPFLATTKKCLDDYVVNNNLSYVEDETNTDTSPRRNWIRHVLRPQLEPKYPGLEKIVRKKVLQC